MAKFFIKNWGGGLVTDGDTLDQPENSFQTLRNWIVKVGKIVLRELLKNIVDSGLGALKSFAEMILDEDGTPNRCMLVLDGTEVQRYDESGSSYLLGTETNAYGDGMDSVKLARFNNVKGIARVGMWQDDSTIKDAMWYGYINRDYFDDSEAFDGWYQDEMKLLAPGAEAVIAIGDNAGAGVDGAHWFLYTYTYDNYQESFFWSFNDFTRKHDTMNGAVASVTIQMNLDFSDISKRVTHINIYCARNPSAAGAAPTTGYYLIGSVAINDGNWAVDAGDVYELTVTLSNPGAGGFPDGYMSAGFEAALSENNIVEELYSRLNAVVNITQGYNINGYMFSSWINQRMFVGGVTLTSNFIPSFGILDYPYRQDQVVLFSHFDKPDSFDALVNYIDCSTPEGDPITGVEELFGNLIVFKELNIFKVQFNNSGDSLNWDIKEHYQQAGCIAPNGIAKGNGLIFFPGIDNVYVFDGSKAYPITKDKIRDDYLALLVETYTADLDYDYIYGVFDPKDNMYYLNFPSSTNNIMLVFDIEKRIWYDHQYNDVDSYVYAGGATTELGRKYDKSDMSLDASAPAYGGTVYALCEDAEYVYMGGQTTELVRKYRKSDMLLVASAPAYGGLIQGLCQDEDYIYAGGSTTNTIRKYNKSDLTLADESPSYGGSIIVLVNDANYVYAGGQTTDLVRQYNKSDMTLNASAPDYGGTIYALCEDKNYVYAGGDTTNTIRKYNKSDLTLADESPGYGDTIYALTEDAGYVYAGGGTTDLVRKYNKSDMSLDDSAPDYGGTIFALTNDRDYVYAGGTTTKTIRKYNKSDMTLADEGPDYGGTIYALSQDTGYDINALALGTKYEILAGHSDKVMQLRTTGGTEAIPIGTSASQWLSLNGNPFQEKKINFIKVINATLPSFYDHDKDTATEINDSDDPVTFQTDAQLANSVYYIKIDDEILKVSTAFGVGGGPYYATASRAELGTTIATHVTNSDIYLADTETFDFKIYTDYSETAKLSLTPAIIGSDRNVSYREASVGGKVFAFEIIGTDLDTCDLFEIEIDYIEMPEKK